MAHTTKTAAERAQQIEQSKGGYHAMDQWDEQVPPLKDKPKLKDGTDGVPPEGKHA
jgi:hypothetical protein